MKEIWIFAPNFFGDFQTQCSTMWVGRFITIGGLRNSFFRFKDGHCTFYSGQNTMFENPEKCLIWIFLLKIPLFRYFGKQKIKINFKINFARFARDNIAHCASDGRYLDRHNRRKLDVERVSKMTLSLADQENFPRIRALLRSKLL